MSQDNRLTHLLTYTVFHIGIYISLVTALIGAGILNEIIGNSLLIRFSILCIAIAGICGGIVGSNIPSHENYKIYWDTKLGYWKLRPFKPAVWVALEHLFFWVGVLPITFAYIIWGPEFLLIRLPGA